MRDKRHRKHCEPDLLPLLIDTTSTLETYLDNNEKINKSRQTVAKESKVAYGFPKRYMFALLGFWGMANVYSMRVNLSVAILAMVKNANTSSTNTTGEIVECPELLEDVANNQTKLIQAEQFDWTEETTNQILSSFFYGYVLTQIPGGYMAERISGKCLFGCGIFFTALLTLLTPLAVMWGVDALMADRILQGLAEGVTKPSMNSLISRWSPKPERSRVSAFIFSGGLFGNVFTLPLSGWLSSSGMLGGWPAVFYVFGILSLLWLLFWICLIYDSPLEHPSISGDELKYFEENQETIHKNPEVPWRSIFTSLPMWAVIVSHFGSALGFLTLFTALPTYLMTVLHFDIELNGNLSALPFLFMAAGAWVAGILADRMRKSGNLSITTIRKIFNTIGLLGPAATLFFVTVSGCRPLLIVTLVCAAMALHGVSYSGFQVTHIDMSPDFAGVLFGISNSIADLNGIFGPALVTAFTYQETSAGNWNKVFYIICFGYAAAAIFYLIFASAELQPWGMDNKALSIKASLSSESNDPEKLNLETSFSFMRLFQ